MTDGSISFDTKIDSSGAKKDLKGLSGTLKKELGKIAGVVIGGSLLRKIFQVVNAQIKDAANQNTKYTASIAELKGAWSTFAQLVIPLMTRVAQVVTNITYSITGLLAKLTGKSLEELQNTAKAATNAATATNKLAKAQKQLAGFDEMNKLEDTSTSSSGNTSSGATYNFDTGAIEQNLANIEAIASASSLALGVILTLTGNPAIGIPLIAIGAAGLVDSIATNWDSMSEPVKTALTNILLAASGASLAIGLIMAMSGANIPLGLGLIVAGCAGLVASAALNWGGMNEKVSGSLTQMMLLLGAGTLAVGACLAFSGANIPLGLGLMAAGALTLGTAAALNWETVKNNVRNILSVILKMAGMSLLAIGIILAGSAADIPLGLALVAAGAASYVAGAAINWDSTLQKVSSVLLSIMAVAGAAVSTIGLILLLSGNIPLGLAMMGLGFGTMYGAVQWSDSPILNSVKGVLNKILAFVEGFINKILGGINWMVDRINSIRFNVPDWVPGIGGQNVGFNLGHVSNVTLPRLAEGAVIPANREFLAVLGDQKQGTNIETPLSTMIEAFEAALGNYGGGDVTIPIYLDGKQIAKHVININQRRNFATNAI